MKINKEKEEEPMSFIRWFLLGYSMNSGLTSFGTVLLIVGLFKLLPLSMSVLSGAKVYSPISALLAGPLVVALGGFILWRGYISYRYETIEDEKEEIVSDESGDIDKKQNAVESNNHPKKTTVKLCDDCGRSFSKECLRKNSLGFYYCQECYPSLFKNENM